MVEFDVPSWDMDEKTEAMVDNIFSNMAILSAKKGKISEKTAGNDAAKMKKKKKKKRKGKNVKATATPNNLEQTAGDDIAKTKSEKRKRKRRKAAVELNDSVADQSAHTETNLSAASDAQKTGKGVMLGAEVSQKKKRKKKKKSTSKKNKYAHLGRKSTSEKLRVIDPLATKNLKICVEPAVGAAADKNTSMTNDGKSGTNEKQMFSEKSGLDVVDDSVKSSSKKRKFFEGDFEEENLSKSNRDKKDRVKKRKLSNQNEGSSKFPKSKLPQEGDLKDKQKISVGCSAVKNATEEKLRPVKKQPASDAMSDLQKSVKIKSVTKLQLLENKNDIRKPEQKKKLKKKFNKEIGSEVVVGQKSYSEKITPHKKDCPQKLPFNVVKLRAALAAAKTLGQPEEVAISKSSVTKATDKSNTVENENQKEKTEPSLRESMMARLSAARFRLINEELYTSTSKDAVELFKADKESFKIYHEGYQSQVAKWPTVPVDKMVQFIKSRSSGLVVVDFGCGDAKIAQSVPNKVHSYDLVALNKHVVVCDMKRVPLSKASVDIAVFCLSLMGTNLVEFLCEANRVLKSGGILLIAEVVSRFDKISIFVKKLQKFGFTLVEKDQSNTMFVWFEFKKTGQPSTAAKLPSIELDPCIYKRR